MEKRALGFGLWASGKSDRENALGVFFVEVQEFFA
jgi:hypothetical protein